jgi:hypothetical protein
VGRLGIWPRKMCCDDEVISSIAQLHHIANASQSPQYFVSFAARFSTKVGLSESQKVGSSFTTSSNCAKAVFLLSSLFMHLLQS